MNEVDHETLGKSPQTGLFSGEMEGTHSINSGQESAHSTQDAAWTALFEHGRAGVGRPCKDSKAPTLAQLGFTKWEARKALALAGATDQEMDAILNRKRGHSVTALLESKRRRRRNPLVRAWRVASKAERIEFLSGLRRLAFFAEREDAVSEIVTDDVRET